MHENFHTYQIEPSLCVTAITSSISLEVAEILSFFSHFSVTPEISEKTATLRGVVVRCMTFDSEMAVRAHRSESFLFFFALLFIVFLKIAKLFCYTFRLL